MGVVLAMVMGLLAVSAIALRAALDVDWSSAPRHGVEGCLHVALATIAAPAFVLMLAIVLLYMSVQTALRQPRQRGLRDGQE